MPTPSFVCSECDSSDCFFKVIEWFGSGCYGYAFSIVSYDTLLELKKPSTVDFSSPLVLSDTSLFSFSVYLPGSSSGCPTWTAYCPSFENPCPPQYSSWSPPPLTWYLGKTKEGNYFLFWFVSRGTGVDSASYHELVTISTILQNDGSLNFKGVPVAVMDTEKPRRSQNAPGPGLVKRFGIPYVNNNGDRIYDVKGRFVKNLSGEARRMNFATMIYIVAKTNECYFEKR
jgi:hypothetical protein